MRGASRDAAGDGRKRKSWTLGGGVSWEGLKGGKALGSLRPSAHHLRADTNREKKGMNAHTLGRGFNKRVEKRKQSQAEAR